VSERELPGAFTDVAAEGRLDSTWTFGLLVTQPDWAKRRSS